MAQKILPFKYEEDKIAIQTLEQSTATLELGLNFKVLLDMQDEGDFFQPHRMGLIGDR